MNDGVKQTRNGHVKLLFIVAVPHLLTTANMRLSAELIDHIFGFLIGDISALKACSEIHPSIYQLAERHLFTESLSE